MVEAAGDLFWEQGYEKTSIGELEKKTGLDRSSLYHAFGNKHALFRAAPFPVLASFILFVRSTLVCSRDPFRRLLGRQWGP